MQDDSQIAVLRWDSHAPYLKELRQSRAADRYTVYLKNAQQYGRSPGFYVDCADFFWNEEEPDPALRVLSNLAEMRLDDATLLRVMAYRLARMDEWDLAVETLEEAIRLRPEEPQSHRDLALALSGRAESRIQAVENAEDRDAARQSARADYVRAIDLFAHVATTRWDARFPQIELLALEEVNRIIPKAKAVGVLKFPLDPELIKLLDADLRIVTTWDADNTDVNLKVTEPSGEAASHSHRRTTTGGMLSSDFTGGYGPERYMVRKAMKGSYKIEACDYAVQANTLLGPVTVQVDVFTDYGRDNERRQSLTLRLQHAGEHVTAGTVKFVPRGKPRASRGEDPQGRTEPQGTRSRR